MDPGNETISIRPARCISSTCQTSSCYIYLDIWRCLQRRYWAVGRTTNSFPRPGISSTAMTLQWAWLNCHRAAGCVMLRTKCSTRVRLYGKLEGLQTLLQHRWHSSKYSVLEYWSHKRRSGPTFPAKSRIVANQSRFQERQPRALVTATLGDAVARVLLTTYVGCCRAG